MEYAVKPKQTLLTVIYEVYYKDVFVYSGSPSNCHAYIKLCEQGYMDFG